MLVLVGLSVFSSAYASALDAILDRGTIRVGVSLFEPWAMKSQSGKLVGHDIEVAKKLAAEMGVQPEFTVLPWADIIPALQRGDIDVIISGMAITPKRALRLDFSVPYLEGGVSLATNTQLTKDIKDMAELNSPSVVVVAVAKTLGSDVAKLVFDKSDLRIVATSDEARKLVLENTAHVYVASTVETKFLSLEHPGVVDLPLGKPLMGSVAGFGVKRGEQALLNFLNAWIIARAADGWLPATRKVWFDSLGWREVLEQ
jgi:polar amino acid transport system substrate-binding protein